MQPHTHTHRYIHTHKQAYINMHMSVPQVLSSDQVAAGFVRLLSAADDMVLVRSLLWHHRDMVSLNSCVCLRSNTSAQGHQCKGHSKEVWVPRL